jgi:uncharacterized delta-60 repeat protein
MAQVWEEWVATYNGRGSCHDEVVAIAIGWYGDVYVTGYADRALHTSYTDFDFTTIKYNSLGELQWTAVYYSYMDLNDKACDMVVDTLGNVYVTGESPDFRWIKHYATVKYTTDGMQEWVAIYDGPGEHDDIPKAMAIDDFGSVYVTGTSDGDYNDYDFATVKYRPNGELDWVARYNSPLDVDEEVVTIAVDSECRVYVVGRSLNSIYQDVITTVKYDVDGQEMWAVQLDIPEYYCVDHVDDIALDDEGNVCVSGTRLTWGPSIDDEHTDIILVKYNSEGEEQWAVTRPSHPYTSSNSISLAVDPDGDIILCGESEIGETGKDWIVIKYDPDGNELWTAFYDGPGSDSDAPSDMVIDSAGDIYVTGWVVDETLDDYICATVKYNADGVEQWVMLYGSEYTSGQAITTDGHGQVYVGGYCYGDTTSTDYLTIRYSQPVGIEEQFVEQHPETFGFDGPHPNPFNPSTVFSYQLSVASIVKLSVYDLAGRKVAELIDGWRESGRHEVAFDATDFASGIYLYRIAAGEHVVMGKMAYIK